MICLSTGLSTCIAWNSASILTATIFPLLELLCDIKNINGRPVSSLRMLIFNNGDDEVQLFSVRQ